MVGSLRLGFKSAGYTYILDLDAWQAYRIDLAAADVVGWYPLDVRKGSCR